MKRIASTIVLILLLATALSSPALAIGTWPQPESPLAIGTWPQPESPSTSYYFPIFWFFLGP